MKKRIIGFRDWTHDMIWLCLFDGVSISLIPRSVQLSEQDLKNIPIVEGNLKGRRPNPDKYWGFLSRNAFNQV